MGTIFKRGINYSGGGGSTIQVSQLPVASADELGNIYQYIGDTDTNYTNGYFYECVEVTPATDPKTYEWKQKNVQGGGTGNANFDITPEHNMASTSANGEHLIFDFTEAETLEVRASIPGSWEKRKVLATQDYVDSASGAFVLDTANPCTYNELQDAINAPKVILIKHGGNIYPFVEKWESDENNKRYVNIASLQRQGIDKGAMYFFFEATIGDFDSPMVYSSSFAQATGKPYTDNIVGLLSNLTTTAKTNIVGAVNEVNGKLGINFAVGKEKWYGTYTDENNVTYQVYTKTVYIPALPSTAGITQYPHGVSNIKQILSIYGFTTDGFVLNAPRQVTSDNIAIYQASKSATNQTFSIEVGKDRSSKSAYVTMVYAKNN